MIQIKADQSGNLLTIRYRGVVRSEETEQGLEQIRAGLTQLQPGFRLLADLTELTTMDVGCAPFIERAMDMINNKGVSFVLRVIPDPQRDIGMAIMSIFHYRKDVRIINCDTLAQAERILRSEL